jgi:hypothetical protein
MTDMGQCGAGLVRMPPCTKLPASICLQGNQRPGCILMHEAKTGTKVKYLPPTRYHFLISDKAQKGWLLYTHITLMQQHGRSNRGLLVGISMLLPCPCST